MIVFYIIFEVFYVWLEVMFGSFYFSKYIYLVV